MKSQRGGRRAGAGRPRKTRASQIATAAPGGIDWTEVARLAEAGATFEEITLALGLTHVGEDVRGRLRQEIKTGHARFRVKTRLAAQERALEGGSVNLIAGTLRNLNNTGDWDKPHNASEASEPDATDAKARLRALIESKRSMLIDTGSHVRLPSGALVRVSDVEALRAVADAASVGIPRDGNGLPMIPTAIEVAGADVRSDVVVAPQTSTEAASAPEADHVDAVALLDVQMRDDGRLERVTVKRAAQLLFESKAEGVPSWTDDELAAVNDAIEALPGPVVRTGDVQ